ncbi:MULTISPECIES: flagellar protein FlhE [Halomonadaceae]|uniref:Flagellar protein FlhE n=1 Tax=Vreelandella titanicae TaxID=664683 RepID=A0A558J3H3_9GAMM|nr:MULTISPECIES: flagellar protein FlhE [Halomonas]MBR9902629.1 flagellar protein FlhE [Gammaproteobacteria bacterium]TVU88132.1 flagellar protein FlhE [Halomonas titanicae]
MLSWPLTGRLPLIAALLTGCLWAGLTGSAQAAPGSWSTQIPGLMVAMSDRASSSQAATPPDVASLQSGQLGRIQWQFHYPPSAHLNAWLCHPEQCVALTGMRGSTTALAGRDADAPLHFRFALRPGQRPVRVQGLQMIVNYQ